MTNDDKTMSGDWRKPAACGFAVVGFTFLALGGWAATARIDSAVVASGNVAVETERKPVQHLEGGIVREILATDGMRVVEGQVLLRIDPTQARAGADIARNAVFSALAEEARLLAEVDAGGEISFPATLPSSDPSAARAMDDQRRQFRERRAARANEVEVLEERIAQTRRQTESARSQLAASEQQIKSVTVELDGLLPLYRQGLVPVTRINPLERSRMDLTGRVGSLTAEIERLDRTASETRLQIAGVARKSVEDASGKLSEARGRLADAREKLRVAQDVLSRSDVASPRTGRIVGLKVHSPGAVVRAGDVLMEIVPEDDVLVVTARISPLDVDHVHSGLGAEVRLPSLKSRTTPIAVGEVKGVGADALRDDYTRQPYYDLKVSVQVSQFPAEVRERLKPGMPAEILVATGERTVLDYLLKPLSDAMRRGMRET